MADNDMSRDFYLLLDKLNNKVPFSFAHFNDGEMCYILDSSRETISRGYQSYSDELKEQLKKSFLHLFSFKMPILYYIILYYIIL